MNDIKRIRKEFPPIKNNFIYFDNASTSLTPKIVIKEIARYYNEYSCNLHRGEYFTSFKLENEVSYVRKQIKDFITANNEKEIIFTPGTTFSLNIISMTLLNQLKPNDEVILTKHAHSSLFAPIISYCQKIKVKVLFAPLKDNLEINFEQFKKIITKKTKLLFISHITNLYGIKMNIQKIVKVLKKVNSNSLIIVDAAQSAPNTKINIKKLQCDFLFFSTHKVFGPTGLGIMWAKQSILEKLQPLILGGGQITNLKSTQNFFLKDLPYKFEAGTLPLSSIMGFGKSISFIQKYGIDNIEKRNKELKDYLYSSLKKLKFVKVYSKKSNKNLVFTIKKYAVQDVVSYLDKNKIFVRGGQHCAQLLTTIKNHPSLTIRVSLQFYNTKEEIDRFIKILNRGHVEGFLSWFS